MKHEAVLGNYWMENYFDNETGLCSLCGDTGIIETAPKTPTGKPLGTFKNYCVCPNGRSIKVQDPPAKLRRVK